MYVYKNSSYSVKTFYGVAINPGDIKVFPGPINDKCMRPISNLPKEPPSASRQSDAKKQVAKNPATDDQLSEASEDKPKAEVKTNNTKIVKEEIPNG